jgi:hypothetical protein
MRLDAGVAEKLQQAHAISDARRSGDADDQPFLTEFRRFQFAPMAGWTGRARTTVDDRIAFTDYQK